MSQATDLDKPLFSKIPEELKGLPLGGVVEFGGDTWNTYADGYKEAADRLVGTLVRAHGRNERFLDNLSFPIAFLYRHYLELRLKELYFASGGLLDLQGDKHGHSLLKVWRDLRPRLEDIWSDPNLKSQLDSVGDRIREFDQLDAQSFAFRYPVTKGGHATLAGISEIDYHNLRRRMKTLALFLDGASSGIDAYMGDKVALQDQFESEMAEEFESYLP